MPATHPVPRHQLALPLPTAFEHAPRDGYSFFEATCVEDLESPAYAALNKYLDELCDFLSRTRLVQRHPEKFFSYIQGEAWRATACHLDKEAVSEEELAYTLRLCHAFKDLFSSASEALSRSTSDGAVPLETSSDLSQHNNSMAELRNFVQQGPPEHNLKGETAATSPGMADLHSFYETTRKLMLNRKRSEKNDAASVTLQLRPSRDNLVSGNYARGCADQSVRQREAVLKAVLGFGMSPKKQHEVAIMRYAIADLAQCCSGKGSSEAPRTVINIGEGKGYVSRAIALCDGLQVVGVDCNPAHKERAIERTESLLHTSISVREGQYGRDMTNLFYKERGHVASVVCRLGSTVDWSSLLRGHVRTKDDVTGHITDLEEEERESDTLCKAQDEDDDEEPSTMNRVNSAEEALHGVPDAGKVVCRVCGQLARLPSPRFLLKHALTHLAAPADVTKEYPHGIPTRAEADQWNAQLPQHRYAEKLTAAFFAPVPATVTCQEDTSTVALASKRARPEDDAVGAHTGGAGISQEELTWMKASRLRTMVVPRGSRVHVWSAVEPPALRFLKEKEQRENGAGGERRRTGPQQHLPSGSEEMPWTLRDRFVTVTGYDEASGCHVILGDNSAKRETCCFITADRGGAAGREEEPNPQWDEVLSLLRAHAESRTYAYVLEVLPMAATLTPTVWVPSLRDTIMIGLHPCGDLGANVCRHFMQTQSRGLLLVSCCWHALTSEGFPLSTALQRRGMSVEKISLLLATQPLDMWATASAEGHRSSAKILFFRSLLGLLWERWALAYSPQEPCPQHCAFAPVPHLEPAFLRRVAKVKESLDFHGFVAMVREEYISAATAKVTAYTWQTAVCPACRRQQEAFLSSDAAQAVVESVESQYCTSLFSSFLGLTVLRMWMCHLIESLLLLDRTLYLHESMIRGSHTQPGVVPANVPTSSAVSLVPLFDGAISPRMYGIFARRI